MPAGMPDKAYGTCPECGKLFECYGESTLSLTIGGHLFEEHQYPTRFWHPRQEFDNSRYPATRPVPQPQRAPGTMPPALSAAAVPFDDAFYDGARLTLFDRGLLRPLHIAWVHNP